MRPETKICETCKQRLPRKKESIRSYSGKIKVSADGSERCLTKRSWQKRREQVWERDSNQCVKCGEAIGLSEAHIHHKRKRSLGRDDRLSNLETLCESCHTKHHHGAGK